MFFLKSILIMSLFLSLNANGLNDPVKRDKLLHWFNSLSPKPSVICLQETHLTDDSVLSSWLNNSGFSFAASHGTNHSAGVALLFSSNFSLENSWSSDDGRFLQIQLKSNFHSFRICSVYAPNQNSEKHPFFEKISDFADPSVPTFLAGDLNSVFNRALDRLVTLTGHTDRDSSSRLTNLFEAFGVVDQWRIHNPSSRCFSYFKPDGSSASRIDFLGVPATWSSFVSNTAMISCPYSDHCAVSVSINLPSPVKYGPSFWKLNTSVLDDPDYCHLINTFWNVWSTRRRDFSSLSSWWDAGKAEIKSISIKFCSSRAKRRRQRRSLLEARIASLKALLDQGDASVMGSYKECLAELALLDKLETDGLKVRSRVKWAEEGESSSSFFFKSCKKQRLSSTIFSIKNDQEVEVSDTHDMLNAWESFYKALFSKTNTDKDLQRRLLNFLPNSLSPEERLRCEGPLSFAECFHALKGMAKSKTPGPDGLPAEFYLCFWDVLGKDLLSVLNEAHLLGELSVSQRRGFITLVPKKGDLRLRKNWRPISLLNVDYKIASRAISARLLKVISSVISPDQSANVPGRFIGESVVLLQSVADYASLLNLPVAFISLDQEKAFDRVDWDFLYATLRTMGFGPSFLQWVATFYNQPQASVQVNGFFTPFFTLSRGVRQGCPLSPLLYIITAEVLAANIRACPRIKGLPLPGMESEFFKISQYADDTTICVTSEESFQAVFDVYSIYERASGSKLNQSKSKGLWLGCWSGRLDFPIRLLWSSESIHCLGVTIGPNLPLSVNWLDRVSALENVLNLWQQRCLSFHGKALVANALGLSGLWYVASVLPLDKLILSNINSTLFKFVWSNKKELVARNTMYLDKSSGGFNVVNVALKVMALHIQWVKRFFLFPNKWACFFDFFIRRSLGVSSMEVLSFPAFYPYDNLPPFFASILNSWAYIGGHVLNGSAFLPDNDAGEKRPIASCSTKLCYVILNKAPNIQPHCINKFLPFFGPLYWPITWKTIHSMPLDRPVIDLAWKIAHGVLYTADRLVSFGMAVDPHCFCGAPLETPAHLFFECFLAQSVLAEIRPIFCAITPLCPRLQVRHLLFGFSSEECEIVPPVFSYILNLVKFFIWLSRNNFRFRQTDPDPLDVVSSVRRRLLFFLPIFQRRFKSDSRKRFFARCWNVMGKFWANV